MNTVRLADRPSSIASDLDLDALAEALAADGAAAHERELAAVADTAARRGACAVLVALVSDRDAPQIARARAFGRLAAILASRLSEAEPTARLCA